MENIIEVSANTDRELNQPMTTINPTASNNIDELLRILDENPEAAAELRKRTADQRLQELPEIVADLGRFTKENIAILTAAQERTERIVAGLAVKVDELAAAQQETEAMAQNLTAAQEKTTAALQELAAAQRETSTRLNAFITEQREINTRLDAFITEQRATNAQTDQRIARLEAESSAFRQEMQESRERQDLLNSEFRRDINEVKGDLSQLKGSNAEQQLESNIANILRRHNPSLRRTIVLKSNYTGSDPDTGNAIADAAYEGRITPYEQEQLEAVDLIVWTQERDRLTETCYAVEISRTIHKGDLERAKARAAILSKALAITTQGVAIGGRIDEANRQLATELEVPVITYARLAQ